MLSDLRFWRLLVMSFLLMGLCFFIFRHLVSGTLNLATYCAEFCSLLVESIGCQLPYFVLVSMVIEGRSARSLPTSMSSQNLGGAPQPSKKGIVSLTPTLSLKNINVNIPQTEITPYIEIPKVDEIEGKTPSTSASPNDVTVKYPPSEPPGNGTPGLWLGSKRSPGRTLFMGLCFYFLVLPFFSFFIW